jgi:integrase
MSVNDQKENPDGSILWHWYNETKEYNKQKTNTNHRTAIRAFERWLASQGGYSHECHWADIDLDDVSHDQMVSPRNIDQNDAEAYLKDLVKSFEPDSQHAYTDTLTSAYDWLEVKTTDECVADDPFGYVLDTEDKDILETPTGRDAYMIPIEDVRYIIRDWDNPKWSCVNQIAAKYSRRAGGISNLDLQDINIDHPACQWTVHPKVRHWDDHILFRRDKAQSDAGRTSGNKTATTAKYPIDSELKQSLLWYLAVRPEPDDPTEPLFLNISYTRLSASAISARIRKRSKEITKRDEGPKCWYEPGDDDNINAHYWRHWATTWYQDETGDQALVDYIRGDTGEGSSANYDQYTDVKEQKILDAMPTFFEPFIDD